MNLNVVFDVPALVVQGLMNGSLERVGGVVRDASSKQVVMWLQEGGSGVSRTIGAPPLAGGIRAAAAANSLLSAANLGVSVVGFALVLQNLNRISDEIKALEAKIDRINQKLDDAALAKLKTGINACQNAISTEDPSQRYQLANHAVNILHEARQYFNRQVIRSAAMAEATSTDYVAMAFLGLAAEVQTLLELDETEKAARTLRQGLDDLRLGLTQLMNKVLDCSCHYLKPEFSGQIDLDLMVWLWNGFRRIQRPPGEKTDEISASELFDLLRKKITEVFKSHDDWHGEIPQVIVNTSAVPDWYIGPISQGPDKGKRFEVVKKEIASGLNKIVGMVEAYDRLSAQYIQLVEMQALGIKPSELKMQLQLPQGTAAAVVLDPRWIGQMAS
jgi:hypothetical protein